MSLLTMEIRKTLFRSQAAWRPLLLVALWLAGWQGSRAQEQPQTAEADSAAGTHWGVAVMVNPAQQIAMDQWERSWLKQKDCYSAGVELHYAPLPADSDDVAADYGYPTLSVALRYNYNHRVRMHRDPEDGWSNTVDYDSHLGNSLSLYGTFNRPLFRTRRWEADYALSAGTGYNSHKYNNKNCVDNELIGSYFLIYFGAGLHLTYHVSPLWGIRAGLEFYHHSNGALYRPNKGANAVGPSLALCYTPYYKAIAQPAARARAPHPHYLYANLAVGVGGKTMLEDWQHRMYQTKPGDPDFRTEHFTFYMAYSAHADLMYRYARRWASGIGADLYYGSYSRHISDIDAAAGRSVAHSPWSVGVGLKHEVFFHRLSLAMGVGYYLYREMGWHAKQVEKPYYERIGVHYTFPQLRGLKVGGNVNAHLTKADFTEFVVTMPVGWHYR